MSILYQGYTITAPDGPSDQGNFTTFPTPVQVVSQVDSQFVYTKPVTPAIALGQEAANELVPGTMTLQCYWNTVFNVVAQDTEVTQSVQCTTGVTTSDADTQTFAMSLGVTADLLPGVSAALSATFSQAETHTVAISQSRSVTQTCVAKPGTTLQVWQLHADYIAEFAVDGTSYRNVLSTAGSVEEGLILALTFPVTGAQSASAQDTTGQDAVAQNTAAQGATAAGTATQGTAGQDTTAAGTVAQDTAGQDPVAQNTAAQSTTAAGAAAQDTADQGTTDQGTATQDTAA